MRALSIEHMEHRDLLAGSALAPAFTPPPTHDSDVLTINEIVYVQQPDSQAINDPEWKYIPIRRYA